MQQIWISKAGPPEVLELRNAPDPFQQQKTLFGVVLVGSAPELFARELQEVRSRVEPAQTRKMAAGVQWATSSDHPILLDYEKEAGHGGAWTRGLSASERTRAIARQIAILNWQLDVPDALPK